MGKDEIKVSVHEIELSHVNYELLNNAKDEIEEDKTDINIKYTIDKDEAIKFNVNFSLLSKGFSIKGEYLFVIFLKGVENIEVFIESNKKDVVYPVYLKISSLISYLTDQSMPFPTIIPPSIWTDEIDE